MAHQLESQNFINLYNKDRKNQENKGDGRLIAICKKKGTYFAHKRELRAFLQNLKEFILISLMILFNMVL